MIQTLKYLKNVCDEYNKLFQKIEFVPVQKAFIGPHYLNLVVRFPGKSLNLLIGLGERFEGIEFSEDSIPSLIRQRDRFLDFIRKNLVGTKMGKVEVDENFRRVRIPLLKSGNLNYLDLMWLERELYFSWQEQLEEGKWNQFYSWKGEFSKEHSENLNEVFREFGGQRDPTGEEKEFQLFAMKSYLKLVLSSAKTDLVHSKSKKFLEKKSKNIQNDLDRFKKRHAIKEQLLLDQVSLDKNSFDLCGIKMKFNSEESYYQKKNKIFQKIKNLDQVEEVLEKRLAETRGQLINSKSKSPEQKVKISVVQPVWATSDKSRKKNNTVEKSDHRILTYELPSKLRVRVSLDARSNDELRNQSAKEHIWFHQEVGAGAHLVAKTDRFDQLTTEDLSLIASILQHYSKLNGSELGLMYATVKELKGAKGSPGKVIVKKPKYLMILVDKQWREKSSEIS